LLKLDASGRVAWQRTIGGKGYDVASSVSSAVDGGYIVAGGTDSYGRGAADAWVLKLDADGNILWQSAYGGDRDDRAASVQPTTDGGYVVAGDTRSFGAGGNDAWVLKLDGSGNVVWQRTYGGAGNEVAWSIAQIAGGGYVLAGSTDSFGAAGGDAWVLRLDASGNVVWQRTYGGASEDRAHSVRPTADGGYIVAGTTYSLGGVHAWLLKLDADGSIGGCAIAGTSNAAAMDSTALRVSGAATVLTSGTTPASILAAPVDSPAESRQICGSVGQVPVVEFYHASFDHFFITWMPGEIAKLDAGTEIRGWARTGYSFKTYTTAQAGASPVCRYYIPPALGDSHFFGRGTVECNETGQKNPSFMLEDPSFMQMHLPVAGVCPAGTAQVYRVFSNRPDANHRYMTDRTVRDQMVAKGWLAEGDGPDLVVMCAPN
jgi:hypothetical protein